MAQSESLKRAKARYYQKKKEQDPEFMKKNAEKTKQYYEANMDKHHITCMKNYEANKDRINGQLKEKRDKKKLEARKS